MLYTLISRRKSVLLSLGCFFLLIGPCLAQVITVPVPTASCHGNGTPDITTDDYMTFTINASETPVVLNTFTVTATQNGNPLAVTLSNGSPATAVLDGLDTPLRTPAGSAGQGNVTLTITDNTNNATTTSCHRPRYLWGPLSVRCNQHAVVPVRHANRSNRTRQSTHYPPQIRPEYQDPDFGEAGIYFGSKNLTCF